MGRDFQLVAREIPVPFARRWTLLSSRRNFHSRALPEMPLLDLIQLRGRIQEQLTVVLRIF
jgi:hypothetical protein